MAKKDDDGLQKIGDILRKGPAHLRPPTKTQLRLIDAAVTIKDKAAEFHKKEIAYHHTVFCQTALPYREVEERVWERTNGYVQISVEAGRTFDPNTEKWVDVPLPFGEQVGEHIRKPRLQMFGLSRRCQARGRRVA